MTDFYNKHFHQGGFHLYQVQIMLEYIEDKKYNEYRFFAALSGVDLDRDVKKTTKEDRKTILDRQQKNQDLPIFRDPEEYEGLSEEEREQKTKDMMTAHKQWVSKSTSSKSVGR